MAKYLFVYHGGESPKSDEEAAEVMDAWGNWLGSMGSAVVDGGNPVGKSSTVTSITTNKTIQRRFEPGERLQPHRGEGPRRRDRQGEGLPAQRHDRDRRDVRHVASRALNSTP